MKTYLAFEFAKFLHDNECLEEWCDRFQEEPMSSFFEDYDPDVWIAMAFNFPHIEERFWEDLDKKWNEYLKIINQ